MAEPASHIPFHATHYKCLDCGHKWVGTPMLNIDTPPCPDCHSDGVVVDSDFNLNRPGELPTEEEGSTP
jgi:Zn finger protein HypA/HybF involved in hydrogenase expression